MEPVVTEIPFAAAADVLETVPVLLASNARNVASGAFYGTLFSVPSRVLSSSLARPPFCAVIWASFCWPSSEMAIISSDPTFSLI